MSEPSTLDLAAIRARAVQDWPTSHDVADLLAEVERLSGIVAAVQKVLDRTWPSSAGRWALHDALADALSSSPATPAVARQ